MDGRDAELMRRIAPTRKIKAKRQAPPVQGTAEQPQGLPSGKSGRIEHMRAHAMSYFATGGPDDETGVWLWAMADALARGVEAPKNGATHTRNGVTHARKKQA